MSKKYGVNTFIKEVHVTPLEHKENFKSSEFQYIVENVNVHAHNGNGRNELKIYTNGELKVFEIGNWKISPIVNQPYNWGGTSVEIEMSDLNSNIFIKKGKPDEKTAYSRIDDTIDIKWIFETIRAMDSFESIKHIEFLEYIIETDRLLNITFNVYKGHVPISSFNKFIERLQLEINNLSNLKIELTEKNYQLLRLKVNANIDLFNKLKLKTM